MRVDGRPYTPLLQRFEKIRPGTKPGEYRAECSRCPEIGYDTKGETTLSISLPLGLFHCFRCGWSGTTKALRLALSDEAASVDLRSLRGRIDAIKARPVVDDANILPAGFTVATTESKTWRAKQVVKYLRKRGLSDNQINGLHVGYTTIHTEGAPDYRNRVIVPVTDVEGHVVYFLARALGDQKPKILNAKVPVGSLVYGLDRVVPGGDVVVVEGVFDAIRCPPGAVAILGKRIREPQVFSILSRLPRRICVALDPDAACEAVAALRKFAEHTQTDLRLVRLPAGTDPADAGPTQMQRLIDAASPFTVKEGIRSRIGILR